MLCNQCGERDAVYHRKISVNGKVSEEHLCEMCMSKMNKSPFAQVFTGFGNFLGGSFMPQREEIAKCGTCGTSSAEFQKTAFLGCDNCYEDLADYIFPFIKRVQYGTEHKGKAPNGLSNTSKYNSLNRELKKAVSEERYEDAARLKKELAGLLEEEK